MLTNIISVAYGDNAAPTARTYSYSTTEAVEVGDLVLVPVGANAEVRTATVREIDIDPESLTFDPAKLKAIIGKVEAETGEIKEAAGSAQLEISSDEPTAETVSGLPAVLPEYTPDIDVIIRLKQLPEIEEQLATMKVAVEERTNVVLGLTCTEENLAEIKKIRTAFRAEFDQFEQRRKAVKTQILAPYERFNAVYEDCISGAYKRADTELKSKITGVEDGLNDAKVAKVRGYYLEYAASIGVSDFADWGRQFPTVRKSDSFPQCQRMVREKLDALASGMKAIETQPEDVRAEIYAEFKQTLRATDAIANVSQRKAQIAEQARLRAEREKALQVQAEAAAKVEAVLPPTPEPIPEAIPAPTETPTIPEQPPMVVQAETQSEQIVTAAFRVRGTITQLKILKQFLEDNGYDYE